MSDLHSDPGASARTLHEDDGRYVWHPFTPHSQYADEAPLMVVAAEGHHLIDASGRRFFDGVSSLWCNVFGHRHPHIDAAVRAQLDRVAHATFLGNASAPAVQLARRLIDRAPVDLAKVFYSDNGSTAVEVALKMAYQYCQQNGQSDRRRFMALENAYHGDTLGAVSVGGIPLFHEVYRDLVLDVVRGPSPKFYRPDQPLDRDAFEADFLERFESTLRAHASELCALIVEPGFQGAGGIVPYPAAFLPLAERLCRELGVFLILDEVAVGMGRSGALFCAEREGIAPDFLCLAKGLTGGYLPLAATLTTQRVFDGFLGRPDEARTFFHGHTYSGNALAAAAALATFDLFEGPEGVAVLGERVEQFSALLAPLRSLPYVGEVRHYGLAAGIELVADPGARRPFPANDRVGMAVARACQDEGIFLRPLGDVIVLMPPLSSGPAELASLVASVARAIRTVARARGDAR